MSERIFSPETPPTMYYPKQQATRPVVRQSSIPGAGKGLYADRDYKSKEFVAYYRGVMKDQEDKESDRVYAWHFPGGYFLDAGDVENSVARYVNSPDQSHRKNVKRRYHKLDHPVVGKYYEDLMWYETTKPVKKGEEFFISYGPGFWSKHPKK